MNKYTVKVYANNGTQEKKVEYFVKAFDLQEAEDVAVGRFLRKYGDTYRTHHIVRAFDAKLVQVYQ